MDIVLIHGFWLDGSTWDAVVPALRQAGHRTHPVTLTGPTLRDQVDAVVAVVDSLDSTGPTDSTDSTEKVTLVGHSGGGAVAHAVVDACPDRIARVVYVASEPLATGRWSTAICRW